jgi:hypothetical protein
MCGGTIQAEFHALKPPLHVPFSAQVLCPSRYRVAGVFPNRLWKCDVREAQLRTRFVAGAPVRVHYITEGNRRIVERVVLRDRGDKDDDDDDN